MHLILFGAPGVGKGTQAEYICKDFQIPQISTGEMLRLAISEGTEIGRKAKILMDQGLLVPDDVIMGIVELRITRDDCKNGFILDGFPRTIPQAEGLTALIEKYNLPPFYCVEIAVSDEAILKRLLGRGRADDNEDTIRRRLQVYNMQTAPVKEYYMKRNNFIKVDGNKSIDDVYKEIKQKLTT